MVMSLLPFSTSERNEGEIRVASATSASEKTSLVPECAKAFCEACTRRVAPIVGGWRT